MSAPKPPSHDAGDAYYEAHDAFLIKEPNAYGKAHRAGLAAAYAVDFPSGSTPLPPTDEMVKLVRDMIAADIVENGAGVRTLVVREALSAILSPGSTPLPPTPPHGLNDLEIKELREILASYNPEFAEHVLAVVSPTPSAINHEELIMKYMRLVAHCEGVTFVRKWDRTEEFSDAEWAELERLDKAAFPPESPQ
jgi:hypothetical protein